MDAKMMKLDEEERQLDELEATQAEFHERLEQRREEINRRKENIESRKIEQPTISRLSFQLSTISRSRERYDHPVARTSRI